MKNKEMINKLTNILNESQNHNSEIKMSIPILKEKGMEGTAKILESLLKENVAITEMIDKLRVEIMMNVGE